MAKIKDTLAKRFFEGEAGKIDPVTGLKPLPPESRAIGGGKATAGELRRKHARAARE